MDDVLEEAISALDELSQDTTIPKNIKSKILEVLGILKGDIDLSLKVNKALSELDEINDDSNLQPYTRTQIWNVVSLLEAI